MTIIQAPGMVCCYLMKSLPPVGMTRDLTLRALSSRTTLHMWREGVMRDLIYGAVHKK